MKISDLLLQATQFLKNTSPSARLDAEVIISDTLMCRREDLYTQSHKEISPITLSTCLQKIERRIQGEPVAYITHKKDFLNYTFHVEEGVLIPRPETELLVEYSLHWIEEKHSQQSQGIWALDIGTGSGCIALSMLKEVRNLNVVAVDISDAAEKVSNQNAKTLGVSERFYFKKGNADGMDYRNFDNLKANGFTGQFDLIISNPPYIGEMDSEVEKNVKKYEPHEALYCADQGLEKIKLWTSLAGSLLKPGGLWIFEIGYTQGLASQKIVGSSGFFDKIEVAQDYSGKDRFIISIKKTEKDASWTKYQS